ncbi:MAG TPA: hypothetical protein ENI82_01805 [Bacteroidetes bacterium]|nr:hypothetical protein [Bacteroidota bacterium]
MHPKTIVLVTCVKPKRNQKSAAKDLYQGELFEQLMNYAHSLNPDQIFILSGKHHLLHLETEIEPYDLNLNHQSEEALIAWSNKVLQQLAQIADLRKDLFVYLTNDVYRKYLSQHTPNFKVPFVID